MLAALKNMVIDAHLHLPVISDTRTYEQAKALLIEDLKKDQVDYAILIPDNLPNSGIGDVPTCLELVKDAPELFLMGTMDIQTQGQAWLVELERLLAERRIVGMKIFPGHDPVYPTDRRVFPLYELCQAYAIPMVIHTGGHPEVAQYNDPKYIVQVAERYPNLKIVIAHFFWPEVEYCYRVTRDYPTIHYDTSGLADEEVLAATGKARIEALLLKVLEDGAKKLVFGTDYAMCNRAAHLEMVKQLPVAPEIREGILWRNAVELFRLPISGG
ncbi:MAG: amidohydrolase family protein [candidate division KSB1 bacterium]|nr:amidohydrolase family protein [candidate division KSB1 bacterium]